MVFPIFISVCDTIRYPIPNELRAGNLKKTVTIQHGLVLVAKSQEAPEKNRERTKWAFRHLDE
jgi:hypothetical protein